MNEQRIFVGLGPHSFKRGQYPSLYIRAHVDRDDIADFDGLRFIEYEKRPKPVGAGGSRTIFEQQPRRELQREPQHNAIESPCSFDGQQRTLIRER